MRMKLDQAVRNLAAIGDGIDSFDEECEELEYTDTGTV